MVPFLLLMMMPPRCRTNDENQKYEQRRRRRKPTAPVVAPTIHSGNDETIFDDHNNNNNNNNEEVDRERVSVPQLRQRTGTENRETREEEDGVFIRDVVAIPIEKRRGEEERAGRERSEIEGE